MPRIDPLSLLKCLSVLLGPTGGIKSKEEVHRLANLMTKFSKKLVSKCIYIQILKTTNTDLLSQFMSAGGWNLIHTWLTDGILAKNWALIQELLELLLLCPVDIERLKSNNCPKLIKGLSKEGSHQGVRTLASRLVEQWLKIVKGEAAPNSVPAQIMTVPVQSPVTGQTATVPSSQQQQQLQQSANTQQVVDAIENATVHIQDLNLAQQSTASTNHQDQEKQQQLQERLQPQTVQVVGKAQQAQAQQQQATQQQCKKQSFVVVSTSSSLPVYKITIRDGNQVLAKVETDAANISNILNPAGTSTDSGYDLTAAQEAVPEVEELDEADENDGAVSGRDDSVDVVQSDDSAHVPSEVKQTAVSSKDNQDTEGVKNKDVKDSKDVVSSDSKSSDKENRDSHKKDDKKSSSEKKSSGHHHGSSLSSSPSSSTSSSKSSKHTGTSAHRSSSTSHRSSSHRSSSSSSKNSSSSKDRSSKDKDKHHSSSSSKHSSNKSKSERDKEREKEKEKQKKDQAEKDKATLEKVQGQALSSKVGKIPKKRAEDEKPSDANGRKSSTESRDNSKENKEKSDSKKDAAATKPVTEKKNISISIENRKNSQDSGTRPKTVKMFNSKFRSTGLEEEVKPPPPRSKKAAPAADKKVLPPKLPLKRPSPLRDVPLVEKRAKLSLDSPTTPPSEEKKGGIKLIPPKPKPMVLQESDMFMDALTASTKSKEPRKRKRRASITKDGSTEAKKQETANADNRESTPPPASPTIVEEKSVVLKPNFKFYQDTLEIEEDKDQREKESEEESKKDKDQALDEEKDSRDDDDSGSNTPTPEEDVEEIKDVESPEDVSSVISDSMKKDSYPEIRYVDGLKSILLLQKRKGPKKVLKWETNLESIRYFELDETERVNVTKTFTDMKQMEKQNEREAFQMARKLNTEDLMEEKTRWKPLIPIDLPPPLVDPGKDSKEKDVQYAREKGILQALYFNRSMIPDSAAEPDEERHHVMADPKGIPLDDLTGNRESEKDFTAVPWPEPKPQPPQPSTVTTFHYPTTYPHNQQSMMTTMGPQSTMNPMPQIPQQMMAPTHMAPMSPEMAGPMPATGGGGWRTGDGKVLVPDVGMNPMANMPGGFNQGMEGGPMVPPGMMGPGPPPMYNQDGYGMMCPEDMGYNNFQGPPGPMYGPGPGPNFPGPRGAHMHNRGRGGPGWGYRGPVRGGWRGVGGGWRGSGKQPPVCRQFSKNGYCRVGDKCQYLHPGVNCPPF
ncbi:PREDICTED: serine/threonine-protein phosphatase 1 regulatory subunit 10 isoform X1 [Vollenhovia emeryi]|uniref:serine/threonine-protein phosphatase 1 regulatory subunit 10 isoform X1 n=2 Tax=Vollenhovia emeryi TaxID=411798 RepID=UPI0005F471A6|nr:PREDICTED: serine/threonine-protein phosphatase 1 regulatory subunit 10 isoform X1 [Vollenhovia emeryi]XP_011882559.1 PREDICTED: serine/threonine-protein phosphatase 1 regulatory subunit 10 isoform X1 [Vollenhovia emeryi]XP_011882560.1 PREDICTED: serine/threonine-protein phosphatase 1 regulatory subunit 10 isoform X1 [Vollenhovia emeryi]XP_011882561.1 PREDICTED: serine/threonine-protein phosphatase 1 regulatory subunit 10 isoform X1 [Vollenhovia emeryi]XP_011882562.1 PREDICTED: serine/threon